MRYLQIQVVRLQVEFDAPTRQTTVYALHNSEQRLLRTSPASWERHRWHLEKNLGVAANILQDADLKLTMEPFKAHLGQIQTTDLSLEQFGFRE